MAHLIVGCAKTYQHVDGAILCLEEIGFAARDITILGGESLRRRPVVSSSERHRVDSREEPSDADRSASIPIDQLLEAGLAETTTLTFEALINEGGIVVVARCDDPTWVQRAVKIFESNDFYAITIQEGDDSDLA